MEQPLGVSALMQTGDAWAGNLRVEGLLEKLGHFNTRSSVLSELLSNRPLSDTGGEHQSARAPLPSVTQVVQNQVDDNKYPEFCLK